MLFFTCDFDLTPEVKELLRQQVMERTGEDSVFLPYGISNVQSINVKTDATPPEKARSAVQSMQKRPVENPVFRLISEVFETVDLDEATAMINTGKWSIIAAAKSKDGYLFSLAKFDLDRLNPSRKV